MTDITTVASPATAQPAVPPILFTKDLPGPLSLNRLAAFGTLRKLDDSAGYWIEHSGTLYGRAKIVAEVAPFGTVVCSMTAAWVWLGGPDFPSTIDVISTSHFRSASVSRRIRVFKRLTLPEQIIKLGGLPVTTPARTACDLVMSPEDIPDPSTVNALVCQLMSTYQFRPNDCLQIVKEHRHHKYAGRARMFFNRCSRRWTNRLWSNAHDEGVHCQRPSQRPPCRSPFTAFAAGATVASPRGGGTLIRIRIARNLGYDRAA